MSELSAAKLPTKSSTNFIKSRTVLLDNRFEKVDSNFESNYISTGKYSPLSFLPIFLYEQFRKSANIFFLLITIIQQIPGVSPVGKLTTLIPFLIVLTLAAFKEIIEDYKRHVNDKATNNRKVLVYKNKEWSNIKWREVEVGDIVKVVNKEFFPADIIMLSSSEPLSVCYIETANIDGETNLKIKQAISVIADMSKSDNKLDELNCIIKCEAPNKNLYTFTGNINAGESTFPLTLNQFLTRGAALQNTHWVIGGVIYTGHKTKLMMNANRAPLKMSKMDRTTNKQIWYLLLILILISFVSAAGNIIWKESHGHLWYLPGKVVFNNLLPISLLLTLEIVKFVQAMFINWDRDMYDAKSDTPVMARTSNLNEELGQVKHVFSDKTGTLTQNIMLLKNCSIAGNMYCSQKCCSEFKEQLFEDLEGENHQHIRLFLEAMSVCHTVIPEKGRDNDEDMRYLSSSPDETALVQASGILGYGFKERQHDVVVVEERGKLVDYKVLHILEFTSIRKRMSVILRRDDGRLMLLCKGADNVIFERLSEFSDFVGVTEAHLKYFAQDGLRTLCFAYSYISEKGYSNWLFEFNEANNEIINRENKLAAVYNKIEKNMFLIGCSAIEDKLQDGVPETLEKLSKADIRTWMLTGDKQETAINIGYSTKLLNPNMELAVFDQLLFHDCKDYLEDQLASVVDESSELAVVVTGQTLVHLLSDKLQKDFVKLTLSAKAMICCRVSPMQKADVVTMVKTHCKEITLAIGDGGNDVSMIQAAHIGVGISGVEGLQAANSSDYSIAQFRFLQKLLLVHGAWNHTRIAKCILYSFYKNICLYMIQLWFAFYNGFSGQILFEKWTISLYNFVTAFPPFVLGLFEQTCRNETMLKYPALYSISQSALEYNTKVFWKMMANAIYHSLLLFFIPALMITQDTAFYNGQTGGFLFLGNFVYTYVVIVVCLKAAVESNTWTVLSVLGIVGSILSWFLLLGVYSHIWPWIPMGDDMYGQADNVLSCPLFWMGMMFTPTAVLMKDILYKLFKKTFRKTIVEEVHQLEETCQEIPEKKIEKFHQKLRQKAQRLKLILKKPLPRNISIREISDKIKRKQRVSNTGFAFSQVESAVVSQAELVKAYESSDKEVGNI